MIVRGHETVLVQGITGRQGTFWTERMQAYGTKVVGGVNPRKAGIEHCGVPVYGSAAEAAQAGPIGASVRPSSRMPSAAPSTATTSTATIPKRRA